VTARLKTAFIVSGLIRAVESAGGSAMVLHRGDGDAGSIALAPLEEGRNSALFERQYQSEKGYVWIKSWSQDIENEEHFSDVMARKIARDPDLWVVELHIPNAERFIAGWAG
jgi:hypothetical protein